MQPMYYIGLDVHKKKISYCVKDGGGKVHAEGWIPATRFDLGPAPGRSSTRKFVTKNVVRRAAPANGSLVLFKIGTTAERPIHAARDHKELTPALPRSASGESLPS
jgi:hypothetical protein